MEENNHDDLWRYFFKPPNSSIWLLMFTHATEAEATKAQLAHVATGTSFVTKRSRPDKKGPR